MVSALKVLVRAAGNHSMKKALVGIRDHLHHWGRGKSPEDTRTVRCPAGIAALPPLDCAISPMCQGSGVVHNIATYLIKVFWYPDSFCLQIVVYS